LLLVRRGTWLVRGLIQLTEQPIGSGGLVSRPAVYQNRRRIDRKDTIQLGDDADGVRPRK